MTKRPKTKKPTDRAAVRRRIESLAIQLAERERGEHPSNHFTHRGVPAWWSSLPESVKDTYLDRVEDSALSLARVTE